MSSFWWRKHIWNMDGYLTAHLFASYTDVVSLCFSLKARTTVFWSLYSLLPFNTYFSHLFLRMFWVHFVHLCFCVILHFLTTFSFQKTFFCILDIHISTLRPAKFQMKKWFWNALIISIICNLIMLCFKSIK
jgi:hypothetical protein